MEGVIVNYKGSGRRRQTRNQMIILSEGVDDKEKAKKLVGKKVLWTSPAGKEVKGEVRSSHGNKGAMRILFEIGMPGQAVGAKVKFE